MQFLALIKKPMLYSLSLITVTAVIFLLLYVPPVKTNFVQIMAYSNMKLFL